MNDIADFWTVRDCLIPPVPELDLAVDWLAEAANAVLVGDIDLARERLHRANIQKLRELALRVMGASDPEIHRLRSVPMPPKSEKAGMRMPGKELTDGVFARDGYHCRFCGVRVVVPAARKVLAATVPDALCWQGPATALHAAFLYVSATLDHVIPHSRGGTNDPENLVTTCWPCNFGRGGYLLEQMSLSDPRDRPLILDGWDGLTRLLRHSSQAVRQANSQACGLPTPRIPVISAPEWLAQVDGIADELPDRMLAFLASCGGLPVSWSARDVLLLKMAVAGRVVDVLAFERSGFVQIPWFIGDAKPAFRSFAEAVAAVIPGAVAYETAKTWTVRHSAKRPVHVEEFLNAAKVVRDALERLSVDLAEPKTPR